MFYCHSLRRSHSCALLFIRIFIHNSKISKAQLTLFNVCRLPPPNISNYPVNSKSFHNHRYLPFHLKIIYNQPTVKKPLNKEDLSNYRPIANLCFISKLTEKIVKKRLLDHFISNSLLNLFQSAYTKFYSTETTLVSLHDHLSNAIFMQQISCLCLLDLSAAFDTLDHSILLHRLSTWFCISSVSL